MISDQNEKGKYIPDTRRDNKIAQEEGGPKDSVEQPVFFKADDVLVAKKEKLDQSDSELDTKTEEKVDRRRKSVRRLKLEKDIKIKDSDSGSSQDSDEVFIDPLVVAS